MADDVNVVAKRPAAKNQGNVTRSGNSTSAVKNTRKKTSQPRHNTYKTKAYREETESPVATDNIQPMTERERVANSLQFTPDYSSYAMRDPYGRSAAEAFDDEYAEKVARLRAASQQMMLDTPTMTDLDRYYGIY